MLNNSFYSPWSTKSHSGVYLSLHCYDYSLELLESQLKIHNILR